MATIKIEISDHRDVVLVYGQNGERRSIGTLLPGDDEQLKRVIQRAYQAGRDHKGRDIHKMMDVGT